MMKQILLTGMAVLLLIPSCSKYPDGPMISVLPRKERIEGKWYAAMVKYNSNDSTAKYKDHIWEFTRNYSVILQIGSEKRLGIWSTATNDNDFVIDFDNGTREQYKIMKLKKDEFFLRHKVSQVDFQLRHK